MLQYKSLFFKKGQRGCGHICRYRFICIRLRQNGRQQRGSNALLLVDRVGK